MSLELRDRDLLDGKGPLLFAAPAPGTPLAEAMRLAETAGRTLDVYQDGRYLVTWSGASPYWWPPSAGGGDYESMHQIGSHGWCHDCHKNDRGYVHHLDYETELAVLTSIARHDRVLRGQCEADGLTPEQYADEIAGRAVPLDGDMSFVTAVHELGVNADGLAEFAVDMWDLTTWKIAVPVAPGAPDTAAELAEELAFARTPKRCVHCHGAKGHSRNCMVAQDREFLKQHPELKTQNPEAWAALTRLARLEQEETA